MRGNRHSIAWRAGLGLAGLSFTLLVLTSLRVHGIDLAATSRADIEQLVFALGPWGPVGSIVLMIAHSVMPLPAEAIALANGMLFGRVWGIAITWIGAMLGAILSFGAARWLGPSLLGRIVPADGLARAQRVADRASTLLLARLVPLISFNLINYAAGSLGVSWWTFLWTTALGILPLTVAMVLLGQQVLDVPWWATLGVIASSGTLLFGWQVLRPL